MVILGLFNDSVYHLFEDLVRRITDVSDKTLQDAPKIGPFFRSLQLPIQ